MDEDVWEGCESVGCSGEWGGVMCGDGRWEEVGRGWR